ncbi:hypothetical protein GCM10027066_18770 [Dyella jejuensis]
MGQEAGDTQCRQAIFLRCVGRATGLRMIETIMNARRGLMEILHDWIKDDRNNPPRLISKYASAMKGDDDV